MSSLLAALMAALEAAVAKAAKVGGWAVTMATVVVAAEAAEG